MFYLTGRIQWETFNYSVDFLLKSLLICPVIYFLTCQSSDSFFRNLTCYGYKFNEMVCQHIIGATYINEQTHRKWLKMIDWSCFGTENEFITLFGLSYQIQEDIINKRTQTPPLIGNVDPSRVVWFSWAWVGGRGEGLWYTM